MKRVVLVRPSGSRNVGTVARASANFGPCEVFLVAPERRSLLVHPDFEQMSHGAASFAERCTVVGSLQEALADCTSSIGFTVRAREKRACGNWRELADTVLADANDAERRVALVFGNEITGLTAEESREVQELATIATSAEQPSLNLGVAVSIVLCNLYAAPAHKKKTRAAKLLSGEGRQFLKDSMKRVFGEKIARTPAARRDIEASIERVLARAPLEDRDARAWHLILRALGNDLTPKDLGLELSPKRGRRSAELERVRSRALEDGDGRSDRRGSPTDGA